MCKLKQPFELGLLYAFGSYIMFAICVTNVGPGYNVCHVCHKCLYVSQMLGLDMLLALIR